MVSLKVVSIGGFGHSASVFDEMHCMTEAQLVAFAPALSGENLDVVTNHKIYNKHVRFFEDYRQMLKTIQPDVAIVSTRLNMISEVATEAALAGCHLICEKPLAIDYNSLQKLRQTVEKTNVKVMAMLSMRAVPVFIAARKAYLRGDIGEVVLANVRKSYKWGTRPPWFVERRFYGGTICWVGIHAIDLINFITGVKFAAVSAMHSNFAHKDFRQCEDNCSMILELSNGAHASASLDLCRPSSAGTYNDDWVRIVGTKGVLEAGTVTNTCCLLAKDAQPQTITLDSPNMIFRSFLLSLISKFPPQATTEDAFMLTYVCLCARDAADNGTVIRVRNG
ncbi:MAG: Gfo/Idh/MocA family oxidoreductase [Planctomycetota bacterium]